MLAPHNHPDFIWVWSVSKICNAPSNYGLLKATYTHFLLCCSLEATNQETLHAFNELWNKTQSSSWLQRFFFLRVFLLVVWKVNRNDVLYWKVLMAYAQADDLEAFRPWWKMLLRLKHSSCCGIWSFKALCCKGTVQRYITTFPLKAMKLQRELLRSKFKAQSRKARPGMLG